MLREFHAQEEGEEEGERNLFLRLGRHFVSCLERRASSAARQERTETEEKSWDPSDIHRVYGIYKYESKVDRLDRGQH